MSTSGGGDWTAVVSSQVVGLSLRRVLTAVQDRESSPARRRLPRP